VSVDSLAFLLSVSHLTLRAPVASNRADCLTHAALSLLLFHHFTLHVVVLGLSNPSALARALRAALAALAAVAS
jgi:hypothetical protein